MRHHSLYMYWRLLLSHFVKQLRKESLKKMRLERDSNPWPLRCRRSALPAELSRQLGAGHIVSSKYTHEGWINKCKYMKHTFSTADERSNTGRKILAVTMQLKQLWKESLKKIQAWMGLEPITSAMLVQCSTNWALGHGFESPSSLNVFRLSFLFFLFFSFFLITCKLRKINKNK